MKKRSFVLLEILIAFTLVSVSILPFLRFPFKHMQKEIDMLFEMELERVAQNELTHLQETLYKREVPENVLFVEEDVKEEDKKKCYRGSGEVELILPGGLKRIYSMRSSISQERKKKLKEGDMVSLINLQVEFLNPEDKRTKSLTAKLQAIAQKKV